MSEAADDLARRIRRHFGLRPDLTEQKMMGGVCFMLSGNMVVGPLKDGSLLVRVGKENYPQALTHPGAGPMTFTGRPMSGFLQVDYDTLEDDAALAGWIDYAASFVKTLPPKAKANPKPAKLRKTPATR